MNRRGFLSSLIAVPAAAWVAQFLPAAPIVASGVQPICFKNIPLKFDQYVPNNQIYFLSRNGPYVLRAGTLTKLSM